MSKVCINCHNVFTLTHEGPDYDVCPIKNCGGEILKVDDYILYPIIQLWEAGIKTDACCSGHAYKQLETYSYTFIDSPYIKLSKNQKNLFAFLKKYVKNYDNGILYDLEDHIIRVKSHLDWKSLSVECRYKEMLNFVLFLLDLAKNFKLMNQEKINEI